METQDAEARPRSKQAAKRQATEQRILDALDRLLHRDGIDNIGVNAIVQEAGVGKGLIYDYFGGLKGLVEAWAAGQAIAPGVDEIIGEPLESFRERSPAEQIANVHVHYATMLRASPLAVEVLAEELSQPSKLSKVFSLLRSRIGASHEQVFTQVSPLKNTDDFALCMVFLAAANYLALRSRKSPNFNGIDLSSDAGWAQAMALFKQVAGATARQP